MTKIYVSDLDSPLGYHLVDLLRTDHQHPDNHSKIIGSSSEPAYPPIHQTINFQTHPQLACRAILDCELVVLDLQNESHEAQVIIKFLQKCHGNLVKPLRVIGLSSLLTWEGTKSFELETQVDREKMISSIIDPSNWKRVSLVDKDYPKRISSCFAIKNYQLENMLIKLNKLSNINATVLAYGILYGRENGKIQNCILNGLSRQAQTCQGVGDNLIPMTHVESLLKSIQTIWKVQKINYAICCDKQKITQRELKQTINEITHNFTEIITKDPLYITKQDSEWSMNLSFQPSTIISQYCNNSGFKEYAKTKLLEQLCDYTSYRPIQSFANIESFSENQVAELKSLLKPNYQLILQEDINKIDQQLFAKMTPPEPENTKKNRSQTASKSVVQQQIQHPHFYREALQILLRDRKYSNFLLIVQKSMLSHLNSAYLFDSFSEIVPQSIASQYDLEHNQIQFKSQRFNQLYNLNIQKQQTFVEDINNLKPLNIPQEHYISQKIVKRDEELILLNQYLTDNVLLYISQAKFTLKAKKMQASLHNLIGELKQLLARTQTRAYNRNQS